MKEKVIIGLTVILLCISTCLMYKPIYYRLYLGDRIKGTIKVEVDGEDYHLNHKNIFMRDKNPGKYELNSQGIIDVSFHDNAYGSHPIDLYLPVGINNGLQLVSVNCFQHNWWNVQNFELIIKINNSENTVTYQGKYTTIADNGKQLSDIIEHIQNQNDHLQILLGL